ncbi:major facilitator superfamily domain-containing protein [Dactylonectria estremocensis]|uniref:Major facilitator superfamily domain-containing protein n=1 Tax=Dactylonectria estremocensis TaxID=1079267 RepID=A0A9P9EIA2_9HYPO|nr:major facilitator superfamily domain-containing protein [Dactylonectria estremocensis]
MPLPPLRQATDGPSGESKDVSKHHPTDDSDDPTYPEGGWAAWSIVLGSWMALFGSMSFMNSIGTFQAYLVRHQLQSSSVTAVGWIFGVYNGLTFLLGVQAGPIFDARGPRELVFCGGVCTVLYLVLLGFCTQYWHFMLVFGVLGGTSLSLVFGPAIAIVAHYFSRKRAFASGIASSGGAVGGIVFPIMLQKLFASVGFAWATRIAAFICLFTFALSVALIRPRFSTKPLTLSTIRPDIFIFRQAALTLTSAGVFFMEWGLFVPLSYLTSYALDNRHSVAFSYMQLSLVNAGGILGRWVAGYFADRFGRFNLLIITVLGGGICCLCFWLPARSSQPLLILFSFSFGFFNGGNVSLAPVCIGQLCGIESYGRYYATAYVLVSISTFTGTPLAGEILSRSGGQYWGLIVFTILSYAASLLCLLGAKIAACGVGNMWARF